MTNAYSLPRCTELAYMYSIYMNVYMNAANMQAYYFLEELYKNGILRR